MLGKKAVGIFQIARLIIAHELGAVPGEPGRRPVLLVPLHQVAPFDLHIAQIRIKRIVTRKQGEYVSV